MDIHPLPRIPISSTTRRKQRACSRRSSRATPSLSSALAAITRNSASEPMLMRARAVRT